MTTSTLTSSTDKRGLRIALTVVQALLGLAFTFAGVLKTTTPIDELAAQMVWPGAIPPLMVRFIGASELLGGIGLVLPSLTRIQPRLTPIAAACLLLVQILAAAFHVTRGELGALPVNFVLGGMAAFVAWGRWKAAPIAPRG